MNLFKKIDFTLLLLPLVLIAVFIIKYPHLYLPHYWDEAWSYSPAVQYMYDNHISLLPGSLPPELSKGHPLLFFFLSASWMKIFGTSLLAKHSFALLISLLYLVSIYYIVRKLFSGRAAIIAVLLTCCQAIFLAQSSMLLPEILLAFFTIWTLYFYLVKKKLLFVIAGSMLILTKETGIFLLILIFIWDLLDFLFSLNIRKRNQVYDSTGNSGPAGSRRTAGNLTGKITGELVDLIIIALPFLVFGIHLMIQKLTYGWYFYPEHITLITGFSEGIKQLNFYSEHFLVRHGQIFIVGTLALTFILHFFLKENIPSFQKKALWMIFLFIIFSRFTNAFLFFSPRYLLCIHIMLVILCAFFLDFVTKKYPALTIILVATLMGILLHSAYYLRLNGDYDLGYVQAVRLQKQAMDFCEDNNLYDKTIYSGFLMRENMTLKPAGFLRDKPFSKIVFSPDENPEYLIFSNIEQDPNYDKIKGNKSDTLLQHYQNSWMWMEIYKRRR